MKAYQRACASKPDVDFLQAIATNEISSNVDIRLPTRDPLWFIQGISIVAKQNLAYELWLFNRAVNLGGTFDTDAFVGMWQFGAAIGTTPASPGYTVTPVGGSADPFFHYYVDGNLIPYIDLDQMTTPPVDGGALVAVQGPAPAKLHVRLVNRSTDGKSADAGGALKVTFFVGTAGLQPA